MPVRAIKEIDTEIEAPVISYVDDNLAEEIRQKILSDYYFFDG